MIASMLNRDRINSPSYDQGLLWVVLCLLGIGLVMVYSASIAIAEADKGVGHNSSYYLVHQAIFMLIGLGAALVAFNVPIAWWQKWRRTCS
jgi:cell division protein FtsW